MELYKWYKGAERSKTTNDVTNAELKKVIKFAEDEIKALEELKKTGEGQ